MEYAYIALTSLFSVIALFALTKLIGNQQISEMRFFDYVVGITIGSIAAEMATTLEKNPLIPLLAMAIYAAASVLCSYLSLFSFKMRKIIDGVPVELFRNNVFIKKNLRKAKMDIHALLTLCRNNGFFDLTQVHTIIYENNGKISILPHANDRPATPRDLSLAVKEECVQYNVVVDGHILDGNLQFAGKNREWLLKELKQQNRTDVRKIMLATVDQNDTLSVYNTDEGSTGRIAF